ncbi:MAG: prephenate dehydratase domain-containing protein [Lentisphaerota bacterium]
MGNNIKIAYLGPEGTYSYLVAKERFPSLELINNSAILDVFYFISESSEHKGIIPIENSSGGPIAESLDLLINNEFDVNIEESIRLNVKLALLGRKGVPIKNIYSHSIPMYHCDLWMRKNLKYASKTAVSSTAKAAELASKEEGSAAIASINSASIYNLDVLEYPIEQNIPNTTQFFVISKTAKTPPTGKRIKTSISSFFPSRPGSLYDFLEPFKNNQINLSRIISRPIHGSPNEYAFFVDIDGSIFEEKISDTIEIIKSSGCNLKLICSYKDDLVYNL